MGSEPPNKNNNKDKGAKEKIVKFPTLAGRDRIRKKQNAKTKTEENAYRKAYKQRKHGAKEPFFNFGNIPPFTSTIAALYLFIQIVLSFALSPEIRFAILDKFSFNPSELANLSQWSIYTPFTALTYTFIQESWVSLGFNILMGLALGTFVERMFSTKTTIKYYFICTAAGALALFILNPFTDIPLIGASSGISGLFAATLMMMHEQKRMGALSGHLAKKGPWTLIFIWAGLMTFLGLISGGITWQAHLGGFFCGAILYRLMRTNKLRL